MIISMLNLLITICTCFKQIFQVHSKNLKETVFNNSALWSGADDQEIDCSFISMSAMSHMK